MNTALVRPLILIVEDMASLALAYSSQLEASGFSCVVVDTGRAAIHLLTQPDCRVTGVLLDIQLPDLDGLSLMADHPDLVARYPIVIATADGSMSRAIDAMRLGAYDFLVKPLSANRLIATMKSAAETVIAKPATVPMATKKPSLKSVDGFMGFVGTSQPMQAVYRQIENVARSRATIFITGESGTGKEVCAEAIHKAGPRAIKPFVAINCGAIPEDLLESELFGHLKGSFTGAVADRVGAVQAAQGGTLFLDEICEMEPKLQVKLLRFLQTGTVQRVGASRTEDVDVRIICATNRHPEEEVAAGRFREDLFYRLAVVPLHMPPLRDRGPDIAILASAFLTRYAAEEGKVFAALTDGQARLLITHTWPGNVRELQNLIRRAVVMHAGPQLPAEAFPIHNAAAAPVTSPAIASASPQPSDMMALITCLSGLTLDRIERIAIENAIDQSNGSLPAAARMLGVSPSTLYRKRERWVAA